MSENEIQQKIIKTERKLLKHAAKVDACKAKLFALVAMKQQAAQQRIETMGAIEQ